MERMLPDSMLPELINRGWISLQAASRMIGKSDSFLWYEHKKNPAAFQTIYTVVKHGKKVKHHRYIRPSEIQQWMPEKIQTPLDSFLLSMNIAGTVDKLQHLESRKIYARY